MPAADEATCWSSLWGAADQADAAALPAAVLAGDLATALLTIDVATSAQRVDALAQLDVWAEQVHAALARGLQPGDALRQVLVDEAGLRGDAATYDSPANSRLSRVLERRCGQPILVTSVWIEAGRRAGVAVDGVGLPGHFIARVDGLLVDPFSGGRALTERGCQRIVHKVSGGALPWCASYLEPACAAKIAERVLRNLMRSQQRHGDLPGLYRSARLASELRPDDPEPALVCAWVAAELGALQHALGLFDRVCRSFPQTREAEVARRRIVELQARLRLELH